MESWQRWDNEPEKAWRVFTIYRGMGPRRSIRKAAQEYYGGGESTVKARSLERLSSKWQWVERCRAFDDYEDHQKLLARREAIEKMEERHASIAVQAQVKALERLNTIDPNNLSSMDVLRYLVEAIKLERLARGVTTSRDEIPGTNGNPMQLAPTVEDLEAKIQRILHPD